MPRKKTSLSLPNRPLRKAAAAALVQIGGLYEIVVI